jgi:hypothetical protein
MLKVMRVVQMKPVHGAGDQVAVCITPAVDHKLCNRIDALKQTGAVSASVLMGTIFNIVCSFVYNNPGRVSFEQPSQKVVCTNVSYNLDSNEIINKSKTSQCLSTKALRSKDGIEANFYTFCLHM